MAELEKRKKELWKSLLKIQQDVMRKKIKAGFAKPGVRTYHKRCREE